MMIDVIPTVIQEVYYWKKQRNVVQFKTMRLTSDIGLKGGISAPAGEPRAIPESMARSREVG
jgi:hypothetical protein